MKNKLLISIIALVICLGIFQITYGARTQDVLFNQTGDNLLLRNANWELGSTAVRIAKGWFTDLDTTNITIGGVSSGDLDMNTHIITNIGNAGTDFTAAGGLVLADDLTITGDDLTMATNTIGAVLVGDGTNFNPMVMSSDATIAANGALTIANNAVALGTDTTENYVATVADAGNSTITVSGSGSETAAITLDAVDLNCTNCINATEIEDIYIYNSSADILTASVDASTLLTIQNTDTTISTAGYLLKLIHDSDNDEDADFLICQDDGAGTPDTVFSVAHDGTTTIGGSGTSYFYDDVYISSAVLQGGGIQLNHQTLTASTLTLDKNDGVVECDTTSNANAITLPECSTVLGQIYTIYFETDNAANVTVAVAAGDTFAGVGDIGDTLATMADVGDFIVIQAVSNTRWVIIQNNGATLTTP